MLEFVKQCVFVVALYGLALFLYFSLTGKIFEIPYLTINGSEGEVLLNKKNNIRGDYMKLVATYNNGNVYGIATLILYPLYRLLEDRQWRVWILRIALVLTLSRTVWFGLFVADICHRSGCWSRARCCEHDRP